MVSWVQDLGEERCNSTFTFTNRIMMKSRSSTRRVNLNSECCRSSTREATSSTAARTPCRTPPTAARVWTATPGRPQVRGCWSCVHNSDLGGENGKTFVKPCKLYTFQTFFSSDTRRSMPNLNKMRGGRVGNHPPASTNPAYGLSQVGQIFDHVK